MQILQVLLGVQVKAPNPFQIAEKEHVLAEKWICIKLSNMKVAVWKSHMLLSQTTLFI